MCGIAGYFGKGNRDLLQNMTQTLSHRGPDDEGFFVDDFCGLGHRRLSIIDLSPLGHQPMGNEDNSVFIVFNGEIYNFQELKKGLRQNHFFKSRTDTEVIIHLCEEIGLKVFEKIQGMFALAIYDKSQKRIILARDRMGKKPLYYSLRNDSLFFGSEIKALLVHPELKREINLQSLNKYFLYDYVPTPHTIFQNISKLEPASYLVFSDHDLEKNDYWKISFKGHEAEKMMSSDLNKKKAELDLILENAVKRRMISDVPLGVCLSGGLDSSAVAYYAQKNCLKKIKTFSIGFQEKSFDESHYAREVAKFLKTDHYEKILTAKDSLELIPSIANLLDEPMADASIIPAYLLSKFVKENVTVALGGDGGDELFYGYDTFLAHKMGQYYEKIPSLLQEIIYRLVNRLPTSYSNFSFDFKSKRFVSAFREPKKYRDANWLSSFMKKDRMNLFKEDVVLSLNQVNEYEDLDRYLAELGDSNLFNQLGLLYQRMYMMDEVLTKVDRASMFNSLEIRAPFLDTEMVEFANSLDLRWKFRGLTQKYLLKKLMEDKLLRKIVYRRKKGFGTPMAHWIANDLRPFVLEILSKDRIEKSGIFSYNYIDVMLRDHFAGRKDNRKQIWSLLVFEMWREKWLN